MKFKGTIKIEDEWEADSTLEEVRREWTEVANQIESDHGVAVIKVEVVEVKDA